MRTVLLGMLTFAGAVILALVNRANLVQQILTPVPISQCRSEGFPVWSPDGKSIAYSSDHSGNPDIWVMDADGRNPRNLTANNESFDSHPSWSPDGTWIAYVSGQDVSSVWIMNPDGSKHLQLMKNSYVTLGIPSWSPSGNQLAVQASRNKTTVDIWVVDILTLAETNITENSGNSYKWPNWSPDGKHLALTAFSNDKVVIANADGSGLTTLDAREYNTQAIWSPVDPVLLITGAPVLLVNWDIWRINADGSNRVNLTKNNEESDYIAAWSPDGTMIVYYSTRDNHTNLWRMNADGSHQLNVTANIDGAKFSPSWSPDGTRILLDSSTGEAYSDIWVVENDGSNPVNLTSVHCSD